MALLHCSSFREHLDEFAGRDPRSSVASVNNADGSSPLGAGESDDRQLAALLLVHDARARNNREPEADLHCALDRLYIVELGDGVDADAVRLEDLVGCSSGRDVALE